MLNVLLTVASVLGLVIIFSIIASLLELRKEVRILNGTLQRIEASLSPVIKNVAETAEKILELTESANQITDDVKTVTGAGRALASEIEKITHLLGAATLKTRASAEGLKAGLWVAVKVLKSKFLKKEASENEL